MKFPFQKILVNISERIRKRIGSQVKASAMSIEKQNLFFPAGRTFNRVTLLADLGGARRGLEKHPQVGAAPTQYFGQFPLKTA